MWKDNKIVIKESGIDEALKVHNFIEEFYPPCSKDFFEDRLKDKNKLILVSYMDNDPVWYMIWYDRYADESFYCWMTWVIKQYRKQWSLNAMMKYFFNWAKLNSYNKVKIKTRNSRRQMFEFLIKDWFNMIEFVKGKEVLDNRMLLEKSV